jgi:hypothetical protein
LTSGVSARELSSEDLRPYRTVDQLFAFVRRVEQQDPHIMSVEYHSTLGYPVSIFIDYHRDALDEQLGYTTRVIRLLPR